jgi:hypothetical protein
VGPGLSRARLPGDESRLALKRFLHSKGRRAAALDSPS